MLFARLFLKKQKSQLPNEPQNVVVDAGTTTASIAAE